MTQTKQVNVTNEGIRYELTQITNNQTPSEIVTKSTIAAIQNFNGMKKVAISAGLSRFVESMAKFENRMRKVGTIRTIQDMLALNYPQLLDPVIMSQYDVFGKAAFLTTDAGAYSAVHGFEAIEQIIQEANLFGILPKDVYRLGGFKAITAAGATSGGGVAENAAIPTTIKPTLENVSVPIKEFAIAFETSMRQKFLSTTPNDVWNLYEGMGGDSMAALRAYFAVESAKLINRQLLGDANTVAGNNFESVDRIVASNSEVSLVDANDLDIYGLDRDAGATWADAYVDHNSGTDRPITISMIKGLIENVRPYWRNQSKENKIWLTGYDTLNDIEQIFESQMQYSDHFQLNGARVRPSINGVQTLDPGHQVGMMVSTLYGIPIFVSDDVPSDTKSRLYLLDLDHLKFRIGIPMQYQEGGFSKGTAIELGSLGDKGLYYMSGELWADKFRCHAKLRDLQ